MLKKLLKKIIGESTVYYLRDKWNTQKNEVIKKKRADFYSQFVGKGDLCFDVGANYGNRIEALLDIGCRVVAVEPQQECCKFLKKKYGTSIEIINKGLGEKEGKLEFYEADTSTLSTFSVDWIQSVQNSGRFGQFQWNQKTIVEMTTLDHLIRQHGIPEFIKIDVEGYELEVLNGLSIPINYISFEYTVPEQTEKAILCIKHIEGIAQDRVVKCNYSIKESMVWANSSWLSSKEMFELIRSEQFVDTGFGDIYLRLL